MTERPEALRRTPHATPPAASDAITPTPIGGRTFTWGERTFVMGIVNVTPDSFSGDGLLPGGDHANQREAAFVVGRAVEQARRMVDEGADLLDVGGESTRPGHEPVSESTELERVVPVVAAIHAALADVPISVDTTKVSVARAALDAGAGLINDVWGVGPDEGLTWLAAERSVPIVLMHNRVEARYEDVVAEVVADLAAAIARAEHVGVPRDEILVDPGIGFGKTAEHNLAVLHDLDALRVLGRPLLLGTSRKSTLGRILDLPPHERVEATLATTALGVRSGVDIVRVHDVRANVRAARIADAIVRRGQDGQPVLAGASS
jgi:dihydropteroate synthase